jgi:hypothetical protein
MSESLRWLIIAVASHPATLAGNFCRETGPRALSGSGQGQEVAFVTLSATFDDNVGS